MDFESLHDGLLDSDKLMKRAGQLILGHMGKLIALLAALIMLAVTFTDITFTGIFTEDFTSSLLLLLTSAYVIYFSLEDSGEKYGMESEEYKCALGRYNELRAAVRGDSIEALRRFCTRYSQNELSFRRKNALISHGLSDSELEDYLAGKTVPEKNARILRKISKIKPIAICPKTLLQRERFSTRSELENPEKRKILTLLVKLIPSTVCMAVTVSVMLTAKEGLTGADVLNGILKLSALPMIGFRGYSAGYSYAKNTLSLWLETKANVLEGFLAEQARVGHESDFPHESSALITARESVT